MKFDEKLPKELPVPGFLDEKILRAAAVFSERRRKKMRQRRVFFGGAAAAAALLVASCLFFPRAEKTTLTASARQDLTGWSAMDQESFVLSAELNSCNLWEEEFSI